MKKCQASIFFCIVVLIFTVGYVHDCFAVDFIEANNSIIQAELNLNIAIVAVAEANDVDVDVDPFLEKIKLAGTFLSEANLMLRAKNYTIANLLALNCSNEVEGLATEVDSLKIAAERLNSDFLFLTIIGSGIGLILLLVLSIIFWQVFKKKYYSKQVFRNLSSWGEH